MHPFRGGVQLWLPIESENPINYLELLAAFLFDSRLNRQLSDLSTVLNYICKGASLSVL